MGDDAKTPSLDKVESVLPYAFWFGNPNAHLNCGRPDYNEEGT
jgi:hypothetical protein